MITNREHWRQILRRQSLANAERWLTLIEESPDPASLAINDYDNLLRALEIALQSTETFDLAYQLVQALYTVVFGFADWERWLVYLDMALAASRQLNRLPEQARLLEQIADLMCHTGNLAKAEALYREGESIYKALGKSAEYASLLARLALVYDLQGKTVEGISLCQKALAIAESISDDLTVAHANLNLSHIYIRADNMVAALATAQQAHLHYEKLSKPELTAKAMLNMIACWARLGEWNKADSASEELMDKLLASGDIRTLSLLHINRGIIAYNQASYTTAESAWQEALRLHSQVQDPIELAALYNNLGMVYTKMREWEAAEEMLQKAIAAFLEMGNIYSWANAMDNLADLYETQQQLVLCCQVLSEAIAGLQAAKENPHLNKLLSNMENRLNRLRSS